MTPSILTLTNKLSAKFLQLNLKRCISITISSSFISRPIVSNRSSPSLPGIGKASNRSWHVPVALDNSVRWNSESSDKLTSREYEQIAEATLETMMAYFEELNDNNTLASEFDCSYSSGVLTIKLGKALGTYVLNKQPANRQIWISSPVSGPNRCEYSKALKRWVLCRDSNRTLYGLLDEELSKALRISVRIPPPPLDRI